MSSSRDAFSAALFLPVNGHEYEMQCDTLPQGSQGLECNSSELWWQLDAPGQASISFPFTFKGWKGRSAGMGNASRPKAGWCSWKHVNRVETEFGIKVLHSLSLSLCFWRRHSLWGIGRQKKAKARGNRFERQKNLLCLTCCLIRSSPLARPWKMEKTQP